MTIKRIESEGYNLAFDVETGAMARWGRTEDEDPVMCPFGPEIADIEISTVCNGIGKDMSSRQPCSWCYKSNTGCGENMSIETFKKIFEKFPKTLTQIAFGIGDLDANPHLIAILAHCRRFGVVPNLTTNGMGILEPIYKDATRAPSYADVLAKLCGAVAVSHYGIDDICFDAVEALTSRGLKQVNIHKLLSKQTYRQCFDLIDKVREAKDSKHGRFAKDKRLAGLKSIVFLLLKPKGERNNLVSIGSTLDYKEILDYAEASGVSVGFDSCSGPMALRSVPESAIPSVDPCESTLFSIYINVKGEVFLCSFTEGTPGWEGGVDLVNAESFDAVWYNPRVQVWREGLLASADTCKNECGVRKHCRICPVYDVTTCKREVA